MDVKRAYLQKNYLRRQKTYIIVIYVTKLVNFEKTNEVKSPQKWKSPPWSRNTALKKIASPLNPEVKIPPWKKMPEKIVGRREEFILKVEKWK